MTSPAHQSEKNAVALLSVISNSGLVVFKLGVGLLIGSVSVISEAIHSGVDLLAALIALVAVRQSGRPADETHPFGRGKYENISGVIEAVLIFGAAGWIIIEAGQKLIHREPIHGLGWGILIMLISSALNMLVSMRLFSIGKKTDSAALLADAWHLRTDVYTSMGVMVGLGIIQVGKVLWPTVDLSWVDPVAAILVACLIIKAAYDLTVSAGKDLLDVCLPPEEVKLITELVCSVSPKIRGWHKIRTRKAGPIRYADLHIQVDPEMTVEEAHCLTHQISNKVHQQYPGTVTTIHIEPFGTEHNDG